MKSFIKNTTSSCLGSLIAFAIIFLVITIAISTYTAKNKPNQKGILHIPIEGGIQDYSKTQIDIESLQFSAASTSLWDLMKKIKNAAEDPKISGIYLDIKSAQMSQQTVTELSEVLQEFKASGKRIYAYSYYYNQNSYLLSTVADSVFLNPNGGVDLKGYGLYAPLFKTLLDKLAIDVNVYYAGKYKSSTEPYRLDAFTEENKFQYRTYFKQLRNQLCEVIAINRNINLEAIDLMVKESKGYDSNLVLDQGLVDRLLYDDQLKKVLKRDFENSDLVAVSSYRIRKSKTKNASTAIVFAEGEITWGDSNMGGITHEGMLANFKEIADNDKIETVIIRINSPGGNGYSSDLIHREISLLRAQGKKVVASLGPYATSGGYYIASACDSIYSEENTLTGSIGVYILFPTINRLLDNKVGVGIDSISTDKNVFKFNPLLPVSKEQSKTLIDNTEQLYEKFLDRVATGRGINRDSVHLIAQGRVWSGRDAVEIGLVDENVSLNTLISRYSPNINSIKVFPKRKLSLPEQLLSQSLDQMQIHNKNKAQVLESKLIEIQKLIENPGPMMKIPNDLFVMNR